ncbi:MAG: methyltransferase domain-containing protein [Candidatus ainarchaeum sp.]|jgi:predicted SAM-dependent methyltransferase|nr:methyltransferase domain-containing protein [Candidatus ainarchaeum sp.]MDD3085682.1 methyltransferase domain-containing protein [Candidatus ainarchaeum sp.]MDD4128219.1 methyltransferase domain-containing protein [Candidatus ainarchaeum sp.]MDD4467584.1 methyltransferase domain-containing protein [Candidatus ainarchaeum sp.]
MSKLEIGSGNKPKEGYLHFDIRSNVNADVIGDAKKLPFRDEEFSEVYSRFFLEHLLRKDARITLKEMYRVLKKEGVLEIIVPNIAYFFKLFLTESGQKKEWALNKIYGFENYVEDHHYFGYDEETLKNFLTEAGFREINRISEEEQYLHLKAIK